MSWNYRVIKRIERHHHGNEPVYTINTVYYDNPGGQVTQWSDEPVWPVGETVDELRSDCEKLLRAFELPILAQSERQDGSCMLHHEDGPIVAFTQPPTICPVPEPQRELNQAVKPS
jgi:hypothetical protein